jgi:hypothetical protein
MLDGDTVSSVAPGRVPPLYDPGWEHVLFEFWASEAIVSLPGSF